uniref:Uncharacterized protein n=1 Tax=Ascaris lumbricoides TaxID=6252 RepID=A0A0M3IGS1_ASCLU
MCDAYSKRRPVNGDWYVGQFIDAVRSAQPFSRSSTITQSAFDRDTREDAVSRQEENATALGNYTDGYFTLMLKVNTSTIEELKRTMEDELPHFEVPSTTAQHISTLQHFARAGGLAILAQHLQLYQQSSTISTTTKFYPPFASCPSHAVVMSNVQKGSSSRVPASSSYSLSTALSPHVIAFSVLLRLDGCAELFVTYDRIRSKRLLRLAMGCPPSNKVCLCHQSLDVSVL